MLWRAALLHSTTALKVCITTQNYHKDTNPLQKELLNLTTIKVPKNHTQRLTKTYPQKETFPIFNCCLSRAIFQDPPQSAHHNKDILELIHHYAKPYMG